MRWLILVFTCAVLPVGCLPDDSPIGLRPTPDGDGARVVFDRRNQPLPDIPFPNDLVTRSDARSRTGARLNLSVVAATSVEQRLRTEALRYDGFGTFSPITVRFDAPINAAALNGRGRPPADDPVLVVDVSPGASFGERVPLDLGRGFLPATVTRPASYFAGDPNPEAATLLFETVDEDLDGDGVLSPREDLDGDGVLDQPNVASAGDDPDRALMTWYERETNTLILRPVMPLRPGRTYAVVLTEAVRDARGASVRSPFLFVHHTQQIDALLDLESALAPHGVDIDEVAFTWTFTTGTQTALTDIKAGLGGEGQLSGLAEAFPPNVDGVDNSLDDGGLLVRGDLLAQVVAVVGPHLLPGVDPDALAATFDQVDYLVSGRYTAPNYLDMVGFIFDLGREVEIPGAEPVPFWCTVPRTGAGRAPPFPVVLFAHDHRAARYQSLLFAGQLARWGFATCAIDAVGEGVVFSAASDAALDAQLGALGARPFKRVLAGIRARDLNNDGRRDPGGDTFSVDPVHTRDVARQSAVDWLQFMRVVRGFDGTRRWRVAGIAAPLAGDFDEDGVVDLGGPNVDLHFMGLGYGGLLAVVAGAADGGLASIAPVAAGGGLADLAFRGGLQGMRESLILPMLGPLVLGVSRQGTSQLSFLVNDLGVVAHADPTLHDGLPFAELRTLLVPGDRVVVTNLRTEAAVIGVVDGRGGFRVGVPSDALDGPALAEAEALGQARTATSDTLGDRLRVEVFDIGGRLKETVDHFARPMTLNGVAYRADEPLVAPVAGWGIRAHSPQLRRFTQIFQILMDPVDPINSVRALSAAGTNLAIIALVGDPEFPTSTAVALARAAGLLSPEEHGALVDAGVVEGLARHAPLSDPDNLSDGTDRVDGPRWDPPLRATVGAAGSQSGIRFFRPSASGAHSLGGPEPSAFWDDATYLGNLLGRFFRSGDLTHSECLATSDCPDGP